MTHEMHTDIRECAEVLKKLLRIDTAQPCGNEKTLVRWLCANIPDGAELTEIPHGNDRASLVVKVVGETDEGGIAFVGHIDTVAAGERNAWRCDPFGGEEHEGKIYGRGAADMKSGVAAMFLTLKTLLEHQFHPKVPVYFCFTADEEAGGMGIRAIMEQNLLQDVEAVIIPEPSGGDIGIAEKGALWLRLHVKGCEAHAAQPVLGVNALEYAFRLHAAVKKYVETGACHPLLGTSSVSLTKLHGGCLTNMIPANAVMELDIRTLPSLSHQTIVGELRDVIRELELQIPGFCAEIEVLNDRNAAETPENALLVQKFRQILHNLGKNAACKGVDFYTDISQMRPALTAPFIIYGPGDDRLAHCPNEFVTAKEICFAADSYLAYICCFA